ncbi:MAG: hypothetical protein IT380_26685 [Myxococcales bacterium]|nr:hypothetical protein [Myxococcales bacterium]
MRDRFPVLLVGGVLLLAVLGAFILKGARRGAFADRLSTFRSEPDGARALFLLLQEAGLAVERNQTDLSVIDSQRNLVLLGVSFADEHGKDKPAFDGSDAGVTDDEQDADEKERGYQAFRSPPVSHDETEKLLEHVRNGATVLYAPASFQDNPLLETLDVYLVRAEAGLDVRTLVPAQPSRYTRGVERVETKVKAFLDLPPGTVPLLIDEEFDEVVVALIPWGQGHFIVLGAPDLATNKALGVADNAQFWLSLAHTATDGAVLAFDEFHHGFTGDRSMGEFAARYGLHYAFAQLMVGVAFWALALRRFGRPRAPREELRMGSTDALFATSRLYREGRHHAHAAASIARELAAEMATRAGVSGKSTPAEIGAALEVRGRKDLARALLDVARSASAADSEEDVREVAKLAALARRHLHQRLQGAPV